MVLCLGDSQSRPEDGPLRYLRLLSSCTLLAALVACTASDAPTEQPRPSTGELGSGGPREDGGTLVIGLPGDIQRTDPALATDSNTLYVITQVMEGLVALDPETSEVVPALATDWTISDDGLAYTFNLREGVTFHDGSEFNADAVKYNYDRWNNFPEELQGFAFQASFVLGGFGSDSIIDSVSVTDPSVVEIRLRAPRSNFLISQTIAGFTISSPTALEEGHADSPDVTQSEYAQGTGPSMVGTGPFRFVEWTPGVEAVVERNPDYWQDEAILDRIIFKPFPDSTSAINALQSGSVDLLQSLAPVNVSTVDEDSDLQLLDRGQSCNSAVLQMNQTHAPLDDKVVRQAIGYALDRDAYVDAFYGGLGNAAENYMPLTIPGAVPMEVPTYEPDRARELLEESGLSDEDLTIDFWYPTDVTRPYMPDPKALFEAIARDLTAVGFTINPQTAGWTSGYLDNQFAGEYPMWLLGFTCQYPAVDNFLISGYFGASVDARQTTQLGYNNPELYARLDAALTAQDAESAQDEWAAAQAIIDADFPNMPLVNSIVPAAAQSYVKGFVGSPTLAEVMDTVWLDN